MIDEVLHAYPGAYYISEPTMPAPPVVAGIDLFDGVPLGKVFCLYSAIGERRGLEAFGVQSYAERDWFNARAKARKKQKD